MAHRLIASATRGIQLHELTVPLLVQGVEVDAAPGGGNGGGQVAGGAVAGDQTREQVARRLAQAVAGPGQPLLVLVRFRRISAEKIALVKARRPDQGRRVVLGGQGLKQHRIDGDRIGHQGHPILVNGDSLRPQHPAQG